MALEVNISNKGIQDVLKGITFDKKSFRVTKTGNSLFISFNGEIVPPVDIPDDKATFRCVQTADNKVMVYAGSIRHHGLGHWETIDTEVTLTGSEYLWIFVCFARDGVYAPYIETQIDEPISDTSTIRIPLTYWRRTAYDPSEIYELVKTAHKYDVQMGNPLI